jgi:hypothetical protein
VLGRPGKLLLGVVNFAQIQPAFGVRRFFGRREFIEQLLRLRQVVDLKVANGQQKTALLVGLYQLARLLDRTNGIFVMFRRQIGFGLLFQSRFGLRHHSGCAEQQH